MSTGKRKGYYIAAILLGAAAIPVFQILNSEPEVKPLPITDITQTPRPEPIPTSTPATEQPKTVETTIVVPIPKPAPNPEPKPQPKPEPAPNNCNPNYSGCLRADASDYDCSNGKGNGPYYTGKVRVIGYDEYDLDRDNDGWGCE